MACGLGLDGRKGDEEMTRRGEIRTHVEVESVGIPDGLGAAGRQRSISFITTRLCNVRNNTKILVA